MINTLVRNWMAQELTTVEPETEIIEAYQLMIADRIRRLPVVASNRTRWHRDLKRSISSVGFIE